MTDLTHEGMVDLVLAQRLDQIEKHYKTLGTFPPTILGSNEAGQPQVAISVLGGAEEAMTTAAITRAIWGVEHIALVIDTYAMDLKSNPEILNEDWGGGDLSAAYEEGDKRVVDSVMAVSIHDGKVRMLSRKYDGREFGKPEFWVDSGLQEISGDIQGWMAEALREILNRPHMMGALVEQVDSGQLVAMMKASAKSLRQIQVELLKDSTPKSGIVVCQFTDFQEPEHSYELSGDF